MLDEAALRKMTVEHYLMDWCGLLEREAATGKIARRTYLDYKSVVNTHLIPRIGDITIGSISPNVIRRMLLAVSEQGLSDRTVEKVYRTLHRALGDCDPHQPNPLQEVLDDLTGTPPLRWCRVG